MSGVSVTLRAIVEWLTRRIRPGRSNIPTQEVTDLLGITPGAVHRYQREYRSLDLHDQLRRTYEDAVRRYPTWRGQSGAMGREVEVLYVAVRGLRPRRVVETGVSAGRSTAFLLAGLERNGRGELWSVDLPVHIGDEPPYSSFGSFLPPGKSSGWAVPDGLKDRWTLSEGSSREVLPDVLGLWDRIDLFVHDSDHTYRNMRYELEAMWPAIRTDGLLVCHDIDLHRSRDLGGDAFGDFVTTHNLNPLRLDGTGFVRKSDLAEDRQ